MEHHVRPAIPTDRQLTTARCLLRYPEMRDAPRALTAFLSPSFPSDLPLGRLDSLEGVERWFRGAQKRWSERSAFTWTVERRRDRVLVGQVTLTRMLGADRWALAFWTHPECWGEGYATEASSRVVGLAFEELGAACVWAAAAEWNRASAGVLKRLGMQHIADNADGYRIDGEPVATVEFELGRDTWRGAEGSADS